MDTTRTVTDTAGATLCIAAADAAPPAVRSGVGIRLAAIAAAALFTALSLESMLVVAEPQFSTLMAQSAARHQLLAQAHARAGTPADDTLHTTH